MKKSLYSHLLVQVVFRHDKFLRRIVSVHLFIAIIVIFFSGDQMYYFDERAVMWVPMLSNDIPYSRAYGSANAFKDGIVTFGA